LFVNYGDFTSNSLNHIGAFANRLTLLGHACIVAVPENPETLSVIPDPLFTPATGAQLLEGGAGFPDRRPADVLHAWTPRENVREFSLAYLARNPSTALIVHLEDNEYFLMENYAREPLATLRLRTDEELAAKLSPRLSHPLRFPNFLRVAHAVTFITNRLQEHIPVGKPSRRLLPGVDPAFYQPLIPDPAFRAELNPAPGEKLIVYTGSTTFANLADVRTLLLAVRLINERGTPCRLVRTGLNPPDLARELAAIGGSHVLDLGFLPKARLGPLLALADVLVQPGAADAFNDYRLPSKIPEFLCVGRPVILPQANLAAEMEDGRHALFLRTGSAEEIADACQRVFADDSLAQRLADGALEFARAHFDLKANTAGLLAFYDEVRARARPIFSDPTTPPSEDVLLADGDAALRMRAKESSLGSLRQRLAVFQAQNARLIAETGYVHAKLQDARNQVEILRSRLDDAVDTTTRLAHSRNPDELRQRDDKIRRMTESFSWKATSPLRAIRRAFVDRRKKPAASGAATLPAPVPGFAYMIDEPADWTDVPPSGELRGWVLAPAGSRIVSVRARAGGKTFEAAYGLPRNDVAAGNPDHPQAGNSGFILGYSLPAESAQPLALEALTGDGVWRCFAVPTARISAALPDHLRRDYATWVKRFDTPKLEEIVDLRADLESLPPEQRPLVSILMPVYNTPEQWLAKAIGSVRAQLYPHWELCVADDASTEPHVRRVLEDFAQRDARIKVIFREENGHISAASNSALDLATGTFVALLDHDDELAPRALADVVLALARRPALEFIYSDEDKIDEQGRRFDPYFKPDWNPDLLLGQNYTCHLSVFRAARVRAIGGFRTGFEGSQDWDLTLRFTAGLAPAQVHHISRVLYHWRAIPGSTALVIDEKSDYPFIAAKKALADHLRHLDAKAELVPVKGRHWRIRHPLPSPAPKVSIIVPTRNGADLLRLCVGSILAKTIYPDFEILVVNNRSDDAATLAYFDELRALGIRVLDFDAPFNFSALNNFAVRAGAGSMLAFLNNDLEVISADWLDEMVSQALRPEIGAVGAMLYYPDDTVQHAGVVLGLTGPAARDGVAGHAFKGAARGGEGQRNRLRLAQNYSAVTAACLVIRRKTFEAVGGFNETDLPVAFNDIDFCLRVQQAGFRNLWTPFAELYHHESASRGAEDTPEKVERFAREATYMRRVWGGRLDRDPAYNPNLTLAREDFSLAFPPR
ncbi:MAG: glycosyl transferase family 2, partial [Verrucomicrobia bacterium]|nr:glycosyl transferase family 2 [Verrucomicrobiota bacterium]